MDVETEHGEHGQRDGDSGEHGERGEHDEHDAITILTGEHQEFHRMLGMLTGLGIGDARNLAALADEVVIAVARHLSATERCLHPAVRQHLAGGLVLVDRLEQENAEVRLRMQAVTDCDPSRAGYEQDLGRLAAAVFAHIEVEEGFVFPEIAETWTALQRRHVGAAMLAAERIAPTRPHPHAPHVPPLNTISEPALGLVDMARDLIKRRGSSGD